MDAHAAEYAVEIRAHRDVSRSLCIDAPGGQPVEVIAFSDVVNSSE